MKVNHLQKYIDVFHLPYSDWLFLAWTCACFARKE